MIKQIDIQFPTASPINQDSLVRQNELLHDHLMRGNTINFIQAREMGIAFLNSRISDLRASEVPVYFRWIKVNNTRCKEYSLQPFKTDSDD